MGIRDMRKTSNDSNAIIADDYPCNSIMVEIGSYRGQSAEKFMQSGNITTLHCVDPWMPYVDISDTTIEEMNEVEKMFDDKVKDYNVIKHKGTSKDIVNEFENGSLDIVYIDGCHTYEHVKEDIVLWLPKIKPNGIISGHDYSSRWEGVTSC